MPITVLLAHSDDVERGRIAATLEQSGHQATITADGDQAMASFVADRPDLVICSSALPNVDGHKLIKIIHSKAPETAVLLLTATEEEPVEEGVHSHFGQCDLAALANAFPMWFSVPSAAEGAAPAAASARRPTSGKAPPAPTSPKSSSGGSRLALGLLLGLVLGVGVGGGAGFFVAGRLAAGEAEDPAVAAAKAELLPKAWRSHLLAAHRSKDYAEAIAVAGFLGDPAQLDAKAAFTLAQAKRKAGRDDEALADFQAFIQRHADTKLAIEARFFAAELLVAKGKVTEARPLYQAVADGPKGANRKAAKARLAELDQAKP